MAITRFKNSSIKNNTPKYDRMLAGLPYIPIIGTATDGGTGTTVSVAFTGNNVANGTITYTALSNPGSLTGTGTTSPITVSGLTSGTAYTFQVKAGNSLGDSAYSAASNSVTPVNPSSFESIATANSTGTSVTFSSIPNTYKHLQIRFMARETDTGTTRDGIRVRFNSDTGSNYARHLLTGNGSTASADAADTTVFIELQNCVTKAGTTSGTMGVGVVDIIDYASTSKYKTLRALTGADQNGAGSINLQSGLWMSTSAISTITLDCLGTAYATGTTFALYGIKGA